MKRSDIARAPVRGLGAVLPLLGWHFNFPGYMQDGMSCLAKDTFWAISSRLQVVSAPSQASTYTLDHLNVLVKRCGSVTLKGKRNNPFGSSTLQHWTNADRHTPTRIK